MSDENRLSRYLDELPAIYQPDPGGGSDFLGRFLLAFEHVLTGVENPEDPGLEEILEGIVAETGAVTLAGMHRYFTPGPEEPANLRAPGEFLEWLSGWVALTLRNDWDEDEQRRVMAQIVPTYRNRGTPDGLRQILAAFADVPAEAVTIFELLQPFQIGPSLIVGESTVLGEGPPHYFVVRIPIPRPKDLRSKRAALRAIIDMEKPAHTDYSLWLQTPTIQIGVTSTLGKDTLLGVLTKNS